MNITIPPEARARVDAHLDAVERQLSAAGIPREKRRGIVDDLEMHISEVLGAAGNQVVTLPEVEEMLGRLDPPEAYGKETFPPAMLGNAGSSQFCPEARRGMWWIILSVLAFVGLIRGNMEHREVTSPHSVLVSHVFPTAILFLLAVLVITAAIVGTSLGWISIERVGNSRGNLHGVGVAAFDALLYPLIVAWIGAFALWYWIVVAYYDGTEIPNRGRAICLIGGVCTAIVFSAILAWMLRRLSGRRANGFQ